MADGKYAGAVLIGSSGPGIGQSARSTGSDGPTGTDVVGVGLVVDVDVDTADDGVGPELGGGADDELTAGAGVVVEASGAVDGTTVDTAPALVAIEGVADGSALPSAHAAMLNTVAESITAVRPVRAITQHTIGTKQPHAHV